MKDVIIHVTPDLDACMCVALSGADVQAVHFVPAGAPEIPAVCPCCGSRLSGAERVLDHPLGEKGRLDPDGTRHAAACSMPEAANADPRLLEEVEEQDSTGRILQPRIPLPRVLAAIRTEARNRGLRGVELDREVVTAMTRVLRGLNLLHTARGDAFEVASRARIETVGGFKVAVLPVGGQAPQVGFVLEEEFGVSCAIYADGFARGISRYPGHNEPDLRRLTPFLRGWFVHTAGFLACWGSRKSPATSPPPSGTPQTQEELLELLRRVFG